MTYLIKSHHHDATPIKYAEITIGDTIARPVKDTYTVGIATKKGTRKWVTEKGELVATPQHRALFRINRNHPVPDMKENPLILAYRITAGIDSSFHVNAKGWQLRATDNGYAAVDDEQIHGESYFLPEEVHDWAPAVISLQDKK